MFNVEEQIQKAIREGKFSDLPGKGKPLCLDEDVYADPDWRLAFHLLRENGFSLPWIELRLEIETELEAIRKAIAGALEWRKSRLEQQMPDGLLEAEWDEAVQEFRLSLESLNKKIFNYNLQTPSPHFQLRSLDHEKELRRLRENHQG